MKKQRDIDLKYMQKERSEEYEEWKSMYAHEVAYLKVRRKSFKALQGDASAYLWQNSILKIMSPYFQ